MQDREFNLLDEKWIRVLQPDGAVKEVSLTDALLYAHEYKELAGETPTQDVALLRLLLAVLHAVFLRVDENGTQNPIDSSRQAYNRWGALWNARRLPEKPIREYFDRWRDRFWLFDKERPFYQVPQAVNGTQYDAAKLDGELLKSNNKLRLFTMSSGTSKKRMTYAQAARWLLHVNAYDDASGKPKKEKGNEKMPSPGVGWLGKLGVIFAVGENLFETLILNLTILQDGQEPWSEDELPCWELERPRSAQRTEINLPQNPASLLTLQSRRLLLQRDEKGVTGYCLLGGDFFEEKDAFTEQMTLWKQQKKNSRQSSMEVLVPQKHDSARFIWQEFPTVISDSSSTRKPGIIEWLTKLRKGKKYDAKMIRYRITGIVYGDKNSSVNDVFSDTLGFHADLLTELGIKWQGRIEKEIADCEEAAKKISYFAEELERARGENDAEKIKNVASAAKREFYFAVDIPFRAWIESIDPQKHNEDKLVEWHKTARRQALKLGRQMILQAPPASYAGRTVKENQGEKKHYSAPEAYNHFQWGINKIYPKGEQEVR